MTARTEPEIFEAFSVEHGSDGLRWREWWRLTWQETLGGYFRRGWRLLPCGKFSKRPLSGFQWATRDMTPEEAVWYAAQGLNVAVKAGPSDLVILDFDSQSPQPFDTETLTMRTPKGYQYLCGGSPTWNESQPTAVESGLATRLKGVGFDTVRGGMMFSLVPLSRTCVNDRGGSCGCVVHDFRFREWVDPQAPILPFRQVARRLLRK